MCDNCGEPLDEHEGALETCPTGGLFIQSVSEDPDFAEWQDEGIGDA